MSLFDLHVSVFIVAFNAVIMKLGQCVYEFFAFDKLDQAFENDKCRNSDTDFQCDGIFPLVSSKFNQTRRQKHTKK